MYKPFSNITDVQNCYQVIVIWESFNDLSFLIEIKLQIENTASISEFGNIH